MKRAALGWLLVLGCGLGAAYVLNWAVLELLEEKSPYRAAHGMVGTLLLLGYLWVHRSSGQPPHPMVFLLLALLPVYIGTAFPDLDIRLLGIGGHRNPIFHSALTHLVLIWAFRRPGPFMRAVLIGYGLGLGSHLLWDGIDYGDVRWIPGGTLDRVWLAGNGLLCLRPPRRAPEPIT